MDKVDKTLELFSKGMNCSQAMLTAFGEEFGVDLGTAKRLGRPFGAGMGRLAKSCGALTGAVMVLGLALDNDDEDQARGKAYKHVMELFKRFQQRHGTTDCLELLGVDIGTEEGMKKIKEEKLIDKLCSGFVRDTAEILQNILED